MNNYENKGFKTYKRGDGKEVDYVIPQVKHNFNKAKDSDLIQNAIVSEMSVAILQKVVKEMQ